MTQSWIASIAATLALVGAAYAFPQAGGKLNADAASVAKGNNSFAFDLYHELCQSDGNLFCSPYSIANALAMTYAGARGQTAADMAKTLHFPLNGPPLHAAYADLIQELNRPGEERAFKLFIANRLWGQKNYGFLPDFLKLSGQSYGAGLEELDFAGDVEASRQKINAWVEKQTQDKIKDLLAPGSLTPMTRLVLTNAIYFKAGWAHPFFEGATKKEDFKASPAKTVKVDMMHLSESLKYVDGDRFQMVELPYQQGELSMLVFLPRKADALGALEKGLTADQLDQWVAKTKTSQVHLSMPKFTFTASYDNMKGVLTKLGMGIAFSKNADFSGMATGEGLSIDAVIHKAFVAVDEKGTEAAAATAVGIRATSILGGQPVDFVADHPFVFVIRDRRTGCILFMGRVANPSVS